MSEINSCKLENIYIIGLGAIGGTYAARLYDHFPDRVKIICSDERLSRYKDEKLTVNGKSYNFNYVTPESSEIEPADLILVAVKNQHLEDAITLIKPFIHEQTIVISLLNGITSEEEIGRAIGIDHMLFAYVYMDAVRVGRAIVYQTLGQIVFGEYLNEQLSERVQLIRHLFDNANIPFHIPHDMKRALWTKFMLNVGVNQASAVLRGSYGMFQRNEYALDLMVSAAYEVMALSEAYGIGLDEDDVKNFVKTIKGLHPDSKTSMLQDLEAGRKTEIDIFAGTVIALGEKANIRTPVNSMLFKMIKVAEEYNQI